MFKEFRMIEISENIQNLADECEKELEPIFKEIDKNSFRASQKVLKAFQDNKVSGTDFIEVTGYGYYDGGREKLERIYSQILGAEDALVRPQIMSGTHALSLTLFGLLKYSDTMISISGEPYDTLRSVIGTSGNSKNSLIQYGIKYEQIDLINDDFDTDKIVERLKQSKVKLLEIQRSIGYSNRKSICIAKIEKVIKAIREVDKEVIIMVDNCYGELVEEKEPLDVGADIIVGSLIKNLGGGIATSGGYIAGKKNLVESVAERLTAPTIGKDMGANFNQLLNFYKGLYMAPNAVKSSLKTMVFASLMLEKLGFKKISPRYNEPRTDIIQTIELETEENLIKFCKGLQMGLPVESFVDPVPAATPGYPHDEIMADGSFTPGSTIELSCDGPLIAPFKAYMQGGITYEYGKLGILIAIQNMLH